MHLKKWHFFFKSRYQGDKTIGIPSFIGSKYGFSILIWFLEGRGILIWFGSVILYGEYFQGAVFKDNDTKIVGEFLVPVSSIIKLQVNWTMGVG